MKMADTEHIRRRAGRESPVASVALVVAALVVLAGSPSCRLYRMEQKLSPPYADFYSKVQYIITPTERKIFLELPDSEKDAFIDEFWERRNPTPGSPTNSFKLEYLDRIAKASTLFPGEGRPGYLTDRGRIYVLFGPPMDRMTYPMASEGYCREVWYYGAFPVVFVDEFCQGHYVLTAINLAHLEALNIAQGHFQQTVTQDETYFDYDVSFEEPGAAGSGRPGTIVVSVPYEKLWFTAAGERLRTTLEVALEAEDESGRTVWEDRRTFPLDMSEDELRDSQGQSYRIEIPFGLEAGQGPAGERRIRLRVRVKNQTGDEELGKELGIRLR